MSQPRPPKNLLTHLLTGIGYLTDPKSPPGKVFNRLETRASGLFDRLGRSDTFLRVAGKSLDLGFMLRRSMTASAEAWLHSWQAPSLGDIQAMRTQLRQLGDRLEVTQTQLELALAALARMESAQLAHSPPTPSTPALPATEP